MSLSDLLPRPEGMSDSKTILVTGASGGIGLAAARQLASIGARVIMVSRDPARGAAARDDVARIAGGPEPTFLAADLSSQESIRRLAADVNMRFTSVDVLINNAGTASGRVDGLETPTTAARLWSVSESLTGVGEQIAMEAIG
jgi:NAD(P)-dependent dehydrogenase (short-subunit alcohol dehydrogenase family)